MYLIYSKHVYDWMFTTKIIIILLTLAPSSKHGTVGNFTVSASSSPKRFSKVSPNDSVPTTKPVLSAIHVLLALEQARKVQQLTVELHWN